MILQCVRFVVQHFNLRQSLASKTTRDENSAAAVGNKMAATEAAGLHQNISEDSSTQSSTQEAAKSSAEISSGCNEAADVENDSLLAGKYPDAAVSSNRASTAAVASCDNAAAETGARDPREIAEHEVVFLPTLSASASDCDKTTASCDQVPHVSGGAVGHTDGTDRDSGIGSPARITSIGSTEYECKLDRVVDI